MYKMRIVAKCSVETFVKTLKEEQEIIVDFPDNTIYTQMNAVITFNAVFTIPVRDKDFHATAALAEYDYDNDTNLLAHISEIVGYKVIEVQDDDNE